MVDDKLAMIRELLRHLLKKPSTIQYPFEKRAPFRGIKGRPIWDMSRCTGCALCSSDCPSWAIEMIGKGLEAEIVYYLDRCLFCGYCEDVCPVNAVAMSEEYELSGYDRAGMIIEFKRK